MGNSLVVHLIDALSQLPAGCLVYNNRGASGIDGLLSTAAGVQHASAKSTLATIGDLSILYDLNVLALSCQVSAPFVPIMVSNNGRQIFSLLPAPVNEHEWSYLTPQNVRSEHVAVIFDLRYQRPEDQKQLENALTNAWHTLVAMVIELVVNGINGAQILQQLLAQISHL